MALPGIGGRSMLRWMCWHTAVADTQPIATVVEAMRTSPLPLCPTAARGTGVEKAMNRRQHGGNLKT